MIFLSTLVIMNLHGRPLNQKNHSITNNSIIAILSFSALFSVDAFIENASAFHFAALPPEIVSGILFAGPGPSPVILEAEAIANRIHSAISDIGNIG